MEVMSAYLGLSIAYIIIVSILLYFLIKIDTHVILKSLIIAVVLWYGLILFYTPPKLMGWPTIQELPYGSEVMILSFLVREPIQEDKGGIYFWIIKKDENIPYESIVDQLNPKNIFDYDEKSSPRSYKIPYTKELHKELMEKKKRADRTGGYMMLNREKSKKSKSKNESTGRGYKGQLTVRIFNPQHKLKKK